MGISTFLFSIQMSLFPILLLAADGSQDVHTKDQSMLLHAVFQGIRSDFTSKFSLNPPFKDITFSERAWSYTDSVMKELHLAFTTEGVIHKFSANLLDVGYFSIQWMPPTVRFLRVANSKQRYEVETRYLPREAQEVNLSGNFIFGSIDLQALPNEIIWFAMQKNKLTGKISLECLPHSLERLELQDNPFKKQVLYYSDLPKNLKKVDIRNTKMKPVAEEFDTLEYQKKFNV